MTTRFKTFAALALALAVVPIASDAARAQIVVSANDSKLTLVDGVNTVVANPAPDTVTILDLSVSPPKVIGDVRAPTSVVGPPQSAAIAPDGSIALVTAAQKIDPADKTKTIPDDVVTVIDLVARPPAVIATLHAGRGPSGVSINGAGTLALVANRIEGTLSIFTINKKVVTPAGKVDLGAPDSQPSHVAFTKDGKSALVTRNNDNLVSLLTVDGAKVEYTKRDIPAGSKPYGIEVAPAGDVALVAGIGLGPTGKDDEVTVIDLTVNPPRAIGHVAVGLVLEGISISGDGRYVAVTVMNGSNAAKASPLFHDFGLLKVFALRNKTIVPVTEAKLGSWCQGAAWSRDSRTVVVQCMLDKELRVFDFDGTQLKPAAPIKMNGGPAGIRAGK